MPQAHADPVAGLQPLTVGAGEKAFGRVGQVAHLRQLVDQRAVGLAEGVARRLHRKRAQTGQ